MWKNVCKAFPFWTAQSTCTHRKVERFCLLLVRPPLGHVQLAYVGLGSHRLNGFSGATMLKGIWYIKVFHCQHVLQCLHGGIQGLPHLHRRRAKNMMNKASHVTHFLYFSFIFMMYWLLNNKWSQYELRGSLQVRFTSERDMKMKSDWQRYKMFTELPKKAFCLGLRLISSFPVMAWLIHYPSSIQLDREETEPLPLASLTDPGYFHLHLHLCVLSS